MQSGVAQKVGSHAVVSSFSSGVVVGGSPLVQLDDARAMRLHGLRSDFGERTVTDAQTLLRFAQ
jgi:hypothetical protein